MKSKAVVICKLIDYCISHPENKFLWLTNFRNLNIIDEATYGVIIDVVTQYQILHGVDK